jgi:cytidyltransferase-like protein
MRHAAFIGRFQPFHNGHAWLVDQELSRGKPVLILVRDTPISDSNPFTSEQVVDMIKKVYFDQNVVVQVIPDIESVNYGRGVGYAVIEHEPPVAVGAVSATQIRENIRGNTDDWKQHVNPRIHTVLEVLFKEGH